MNRDSRGTLVPESAVGIPKSLRTHRILAVAGFAFLTALSARISVPLPGVAVPMTLQPVAVLLAGAILGARAGAASQAVYLAIGAAGLPVFAAGGGATYLLGPTGGYLLAFPLAAAVAGGAAVRGRPLVSQAAWLIAAVLMIHAGGLSWLWITAGADTVRAVGLERFIIGDVLKVALVLAIAAGSRSVAHRRTS
jgi:biotin transport system substrate-specific component